MILQLSKCIVELKDELTWYEEELIKSEIASNLRFSGAAMSGVDAIKGTAILDIKMKAFEMFIVSIKEGEKVIPFSVNWVKGLSKEDGNKLAEAIGGDGLGIKDSKKKLQN
jgi:hypothetical protein